jgi:hypothetical protein
MHDVLPSGGVSSEVQQAADQYYTKLGPVRNSVLLFQYFKLYCKAHIDKQEYFPRRNLELMLSII